MELKVIHNTQESCEPWYAAGLHFTCTQCGNCCTGGPGYVWISKEEIQRLAQHLKLTPGQVINRYCRSIDGKYSLRENRNERGEHDCIFLKEEKVSQGSNGQQVVFTRRICQIYDFRPLQCRTWPFWAENLRDPDRWNRSAQRCHGINRGTRLFTRRQIEALRDATDWPQNPRTSK